MDLSTSLRDIRRFARAMSSGPDCGHDPDGSFSHGNTCARGGGGGSTAVAEKPHAGGESSGKVKKSTYDKLAENQDYQDTCFEIFGKEIHPKELLSLVAAHQLGEAIGKKVRPDISVTVGKNPKINIYYNDESVELSRAIYRDADGKIVIENREFFIKDESLSGKGIGTKVFSNQVNSAIKMEVDRLECFAAGNYEKSLLSGRDKMNGYITWAKFGYDGLIGGYWINNHRHALAKLGVSKRDIAYDNVKVSDLMKSPEGRELWYKKGTGTRMEFDLTKGSLSRRVLSEYRKEKGIDPADQPNRFQKEVQPWQPSKNPSSNPSGQDTNSRPKQPVKMIRSSMASGIGLPGSKLRSGSPISRHAKAGDLDDCGRRPDNGEFDLGNTCGQLHATHDRLQEVRKGMERGSQPARRIKSIAAAIRSAHGALQGGGNAHAPLSYAADTLRALDRETRGSDINDEVKRARQAVANITGSLPAYREPVAAPRHGEQPPPIPRHGEQPPPLPPSHPIDRVLQSARDKSIHHARKLIASLPRGQRSIGKIAAKIALGFMDRLERGVTEAMQGVGSSKQHKSRHRLNRRVCRLAKTENDASEYLYKESIVRMGPAISPSLEQKAAKRPVAYRVGSDTAVARYRGYYREGGVDVPARDDILTRDEVGFILADQHGNRRAHVKASYMIDKWVVSDEFRLMAVPLWAINPYKFVRPDDPTHSSGPLIVDGNKRGRTKRLGSFGSSLDLFILDGKHRYYELIRAGKNSTYAYVGNKVIPILEDLITNYGPVRETFIRATRAFYDDPSPVTQAYLIKSGSDVGLSEDQVYKLIDKFHHGQVLDFPSGEFRESGNISKEPA